MTLHDLYLSGGRPCSEMFARLDGYHQRHRILTSPQQLQGQGHVRINLVQGWWVNKSLPEVERWMWEMDKLQAIDGAVVVERNERELGIIREEMHPWTSFNPYRAAREDEVRRKIRSIRNAETRQRFLEMAYMLAVIRYHEETA